MKDINRPLFENLGGIIKFNFVPIEHVDSIDIPIKGIITQPVSLASGKQWFSGYGTLGSISFTETPEKTNAGELFKRVFTAFCPKDDEEIDTLFNEMRNMQFLLDYTDSNGLRKLIGSIDEPLKFSASLNTKSQMQELAGHSISFFGDGTHKSYVYLG